MGRILTGLTALFLIAATLLFPQQLQPPEDPVLKKETRKPDFAHAEAIFKGDKSTLQRLLTLRRRYTNA